MFCFVAKFNVMTCVESGLWCVQPPLHRITAVMENNISLMIKGKLVFFSFAIANYECFKWNMR